MCLTAKMTFKDILSDYKTWLGFAGASITAYWAYKKDKNKNKASAKKEIAEEDSIRFNTFLSKEKRQAEREKDYEERIEKLIEKLEELTKDLDECKHLRDQALLLNKELNAEKNLWLIVNADKT